MKRLVGFFFRSVWNQAHTRAPLGICSSRPHQPATRTSASGVSGQLRASFSPSTRRVTVRAFASTAWRVAYFFGTARRNSAVPAISLIAAFGSTPAVVGGGARRRSRDGRAGCSAAQANHFTRRRRAAGASSPSASPSTHRPTASNRDPVFASMNGAGPDPSAVSSTCLDFQDLALGAQLAGRLALLGDGLVGGREVAVGRVQDRDPEADLQRVRPTSALTSPNREPEGPRRGPAARRTPRAPSRRPAAAGPARRGSPTESAFSDFGSSVGWYFSNIW